MQTGNVIHVHSLLSRAKVCSERGIPKFLPVHAEPCLSDHEGCLLSHSCSFLLSRASKSHAKTQVRPWVRKALNVACLSLQQVPMCMLYVSAALASCCGFCRTLTLAQRAPPTHCQGEGDTLSLLTQTLSGHVYLKEVLVKTAFQL